MVTLLGLAVASKFSEVPRIDKLPAPPIVTAFPPITIELEPVWMLPAPMMDSIFVPVEPLAPRLLLLPPRVIIPGAFCIHEEVVPMTAQLLRLSAHRDVLPATRALVALRMLVELFARLATLRLRPTEVD
jgi:hypothetical protein